MKWQDVRMHKLRYEVDLLKEPVGTRSVGRLWPEDLEGNRPAVLAVFGEIHRGHPAATDFLLDLVAVGKGSLDPMH